MMLGLDGQGWMSEKDAGGMQRGMLGKLASGKANEADICDDLEKKMVLSSRPSHRATSFSHSVRFNFQPCDSGGE